MEAVLRLVDPVVAGDAARYVGVGLELTGAEAAVLFADLPAAGAFLRRHACEPVFEAVPAPVAALA